MHPVPHRLPQQEETAIAEDLRTVTTGCVCAMWTGRLRHNHSGTEKRLVSFRGFSQTGDGHA